MGSYLHVGNWYLRIRNNNVLYVDEEYAWQEKKVWRSVGGSLGVLFIDSEKKQIDDEEFQWNEWWRAHFMELNILM